MKMRPLLLPTLAGLACAALTGCPDQPPSIEPPPPPEHKVLTRTDPIAAGAACANGGTAVRVGHDRNDDGALADDEIESTRDVCTPDAPAGPATLTRVDDEPAGAHCEHGGRAVHIGPDRNGNGTLDDDEIASTSYACDESDLRIGTFTEAMWSDPAAVASLEHARVVLGDLELPKGAPVSLPNLELISGSIRQNGLDAPTQLDLPALTQLGGGLDLYAAALTGDLAFPALTQVGGSVSLDGVATGALSAPVLASVAGSLSVTSSGVTRIDLPRLGTVGGTLQIEDNHVLTHVDLNVTAIGQDLRIGSNWVLADLDAFGRLARVDHDVIFYTGDIKVAALTLPALVEIGHDLRIEDEWATTGAFPALTTIGGALQITDNDNLASMSFPALRYIAGTVEIQRDHKLTALDLSAVAAIDGTADQCLHVADTRLAELSLPSLRQATGMVMVGGDSLAAIRLPALTQASRLWLSGKPLTTVELPQLATVPELRILGPATDLRLHPDLAITSMFELGASTRTSPPAVRLLPGAGLSLWGNPGLVDLHGLDLPDTLSQLTVGQDPALPSLAGLGAITTVTGAVDLSSNDALTDLRGLDHLVHVGTTLTIAYDGQLATLDGLAALAQVDGAIEVRNVAVPADQIAAFEARFAH